MSLELSGEAPQFDAGTAATLSGHPYFIEALRKSAGDKARLYDADRRLHRFALDRGSSLLGLFALALRYSDQGFTVGGLQAMRAESNFCSAGRASAFVATMRKSGHFMDAGRVPQARARRLAVSEAFIAFQMSRVKSDIECLSLVSEVGAHGLSALARPGYFEHYMRVVGRGLAQVANFHNARVEFFSERNTGLLLLFTLVANNAAALESKPVSLSISQLSRQFEASRTHVLRLLRDADKEGLIVWKPAERHITLQPRMVRAIKSYFAFLFAGTAYSIWTVESEQRS